MARSHPHLDPAGYGPDVADHTFPEDARSEPFGTYEFAVAADQSFRYAGASGDRSPMHIDDEAAQRAGFPSKFLQGLCTFAMTSGAVVKLGADGDIARLRRLATRFSSPVFPHNDLTVELYDAGTTDSRRPRPRLRGHLRRPDRPQARPRRDPPRLTPTHTRNLRHQTSYFLVW